MIKLAFITFILPLFIFAEVNQCLKKIENKISPACKQSIEHYNSNLKQNLIQSKSITESTEIKIISTYTLNSYYGGGEFLVLNQFNEKYILANYFKVSLFATIFNTVQCDLSLIRQEKLIKLEDKDLYLNTMIQCYDLKDQKPNSNKPNDKKYSDPSTWISI